MNTRPQQGDIMEDHGKAPEGECVYCDKERAAGNRYHPRHNASERCQSGKHPHCTCDTCY